MVGFSIDGTTFNSRALIWQHKVPVDLNTLIPKNSPWYLQGAESINDAGEIVGYGLIHSSLHAFRATPSSGEFGGESFSAAAQDPNGPTVLSDEARRLLQQRLGFGRFGAWLMGPR